MSSVNVLCACVACSRARGELGEYMSVGLDDSLWMELVEVSRVCVGGPLGAMEKEAGERVPA